MPTPIDNNASTEETDLMYKTFLRRQQARGIAASKPLVVSKSIAEMKEELRAKLIALCPARCYKKIFDYMKQPAQVDTTNFYQLLRDLDFRINTHDSSLLLRSLTGTTAPLPFHQFCKLIVQDTTVNWAEMRASVQPKTNNKFCTDQWGKKRLRPEHMANRLHQQQNNAASQFGQTNMKNKGIEMLVHEQLEYRSRHKHETLKLIKKLFNPVYNKQTRTRMCRASHFVSGIRRLGLTVANRDLKEIIAKYSIVVSINGVKETKLIDLDRFITKGISRPDISKSPAAAITVKKKRVVIQNQLPNRGIPDDYGIRRIATPKLKPLILQKINERSKPRGGMCLEAFRMFNPGISSDGVPKTITKSYFNQKLKDYGLVLNQTRSDQLLMEVDVDGGGDVSFNEFAEHFIPKGVGKGSLTDVLASGTESSTNSPHNPHKGRKSRRSQKNNMAIKQSDREFIQQHFPDAIDEEMNDTHPQQDTPQHYTLTPDTGRSSPGKDNYKTLSDAAWVTVASPLRNTRPVVYNKDTFRSQRSRKTPTKSEASFQAGLKHTRSLHSLIKHQPMLRSSPILKKAGIVRRCRDEFDLKKPWYQRNRQPSRLNWRRLGVEKAAGTITGSYSQCSLRKGAEMYQL